MASQTNFVDGFKEVAKEKMAMLNRQHNELMESKRSEEEERLMLMDISKLDPTQQEWIKLKRRNLVNKLRMESDSSGCWYVFQSHVMLMFVLLISNEKAVMEYW